MDIIILGLLMMGNWTIYEMRKSIETNFSSISSNSMGSIQATIKKLLEKELIKYTEYVEHSVNKKKYAITKAGKETFKLRVSEPIHYKEKNMELVKFFFLGFVDKTKRIEQINGYIAELQEELEILKNIDKIKTKTKFDENYLNELIQYGAEKEVTSPQHGKTGLDNIYEIASFQYATLELSIAKIEFEINWFIDFRNKIQKGR